MAAFSGSKLKRGMQYASAGLAAWRMGKGRDQALRQRSAEHLAAKLGRLHGLPQKMGQILSMSADAERAECFMPLQDAASALPLEDLLPVMEEAWGQDPHSVFKSIEVNGLAASLGQVHKAVLRDGRTVAIKIQYPGIADAVETDLGALGWISKPVGDLRQGFDQGAYFDVIRESLDEELDYRSEARNQVDIAKAGQGLGIVVPEVISELSAGRVLTTAWEDGESIEQVRSWSAKERCALGRRMLEQFMTMTFEHGLAHADPHPGNYRFRRGSASEAAEVVLYDYGCVYRLTVEERLTILRLIAGAASGEAAEDPFPLLVGLGFDADLLRPLRHKLPALCRILFEPFASGGQFDMGEWKSSDRISAVLGEDRLNFRIAGPAHLLFFLRAYHGLTFYLKTLDAPVLWSRALKELCVRHGQALSALEFDEPADPSTTYGCLAQNLTITVTEAGIRKARISLPAGCIERLESLLEEDVRIKIVERGIDLDQLLEAARARSYAPQDIFVLEEGERRFEVRLE